MRLICIVAILASHSAMAIGEDYIQEFHRAWEVKDSSPQAFADGMVRSFHHAAEAKNTRYTGAAGLAACEGIYNQGKIVESGRLAREVITALVPLVGEFPDSTAFQRVRFFGYMERGLRAEGKIGAAWQANRAAAEVLRGKNIPADGDGPSITLKDIQELSPDLIGYSLRVVRNEAELLDLAGRSNEARKLLDSTASYFGDDWPTRFDSNQRFFAFQLLACRADLIDFLGYREEAIQAQQDLLAAIQGPGVVESSQLILHINTLGNLSEWTGPSQEILVQARQIAARIKEISSYDNSDRLLAKMELDFKQSSEPIEALRQNFIKNQSLGDSYEAYYAERDYIIARAEAGESNLDAAFGSLLTKLHTHGNKHAEPTLYRSYGNYLVKQKRPAEAIAIYVECLRLTRGFGWFLHEPNILKLLIEARISAGDLAGARVNLAELDEWLKNHPDAPAVNRASVVGIRATTLAALGDEAASREAFQLARKIAAGLPAYQQTDYSPEQEKIALDGKPATPLPPTTGTQKTPALRVQPLEVVSIAAPGNAAGTRFTVFNPTAQSLAGNFVFTGPGPAGDKAIHFTAGLPSAIFKKPLAIAAGSEARIEVAMAAGTEIDTAKIQVAWENAGQEPGPSATWEVTWNSAAQRSVVLDASMLESNPFRSVSLFHELAIPPGETIGIPFRLRSPIPLRFEYVDATTHELIAIDANGNGDFNETGDLYIRGPGSVSAAIYPISPNGKTLTAEVRVFSPDGLPPITVGKPLVLEAEIYQNGAWVKEAEDTLK
jgi:tetratricopeptide (TPR) repeat protein